jgi:hypothetical protein
MCITVLHRHDLGPCIMSTAAVVSDAAQGATPALCLQDWHDLWHWKGMLLHTIHAAATHSTYAQGTYPIHTAGTQQQHTQEVC